MRAGLIVLALFAGLVAVISFVPSLSIAYVVAAVIAIIIYFAVRAKNKAEAQPPPGTGYFEYNTQMLTGDDVKYSKCTYCDGTVYYDYGHNVGIRPIGYYQKADETQQGEYVIQSEAGAEIGLVSAGIIGEVRYVYLSRIGTYNIFRNAWDEMIREGYTEEQKNPVQFPVPSTECFAKVGAGVILDNSTDDVIATYEGDPIGAAAAFVALSYEAHSQTKYRQFWLEYADRARTGKGSAV